MAIKRAKRQERLIVNQHAEVIQRIFIKVKVALIVTHLTLRCRVPSREPMRLFFGMTWPGFEPHNQWFK